MRYFVFLTFVLVLVLGTPRISVADDLEAYDNAVAACMDVIAPGYVQFLMTGALPEGKSFQDIMVAKEDFKDLSLCLEANGFRQNNLTDFSSYGEVLPNKREMKDAGLAVSGMPEQAADNTKTTPASKTPASNVGKKQVIESKESTPLFVPLDKQGKSKKYIYIPD